MRTFISILFVLVLILGCHRAYREGRNPKSSEELQVAERALQLSNLTEQLLQEAPAELNAVLTDFSEDAVSFNNFSQRDGPYSLRARDAFDRLRFHATEVDKVLTKESYPALYDRWQTVRIDYIKKIALQLGYKLE